MRVAEWESSLSDKGYPVNREARGLLDRSIDCIGRGMTDAKTIFAPTAENGCSVTMHHETPM